MATTQTVTGAGDRAGISTSPSHSISLVPGHVRGPDPRVVGFVAALVIVSAAIVTGCLLRRARAGSSVTGQ